MDISTPIFPSREYTFIVKEILFERGTLLVQYIPSDVNLTSVTYNIPIWPDIDVNNLGPYVDRWAPLGAWYAQTVILEHGSTLIKDIQ